MGAQRDFTGLAHAQANPTVPGVAHTNPAWDWTGLTIWAAPHEGIPGRADGQMLPNVLSLCYVVGKKC